MRAPWRRGKRNLLSRTTEMQIPLEAGFVRERTFAIDILDVWYGVSRAYMSVDVFIPHFPDELPDFGMQFAPTL